LVQVIIIPIHRRKAAEDD